MANFTKLFGNAEAKSRLSAAILRGTLPHALLIVGPRGSGRKTLATEIAAALTCKTSTARDIPCGICQSCKRVKDRSHTDVKYLTKQPGKATIGVEEVRTLREDMFLSPAEAEQKVYIIENADAMTAQSQNALLKVLEEPPATVHIILISASQDKLLSTIRSRAQCIRTEIFKREDIENYLRKNADIPYGTSDESIVSAALFSGGTIGVGLEGLSPARSEENERQRALIRSFIDALPKRAPTSLLYTAIMAFPTKREELRSSLELSLFAIRDLIAIRTTEQCELLFFQSREEAEAAAGSLTLARLCGISSIILGAIEDADRNVVTQAMLTDLLLRIKQL